MATHAPRSLLLLPALGLCSCVVSGELGPTAAPTAGPDTKWIEADAAHQPLTMFEAAARSGQASLAAGNFAAAHDALQIALNLQPERAELRLAQVDALLGLGQLETAKLLLDEMRAESTAATVTAIDVLAVRVHERERAIGFAACDTTIDQRRRPLTRDNDFLAAWNQLRAGLPNTDEIPISSLDPRGRIGHAQQEDYQPAKSVRAIPASAAQARDILCGEDLDCAVDEPLLIRLELGQEASVGLVVPHADGSVSVLPDLVRPKWTSCGDDSNLSLERVGQLLRVRVVSDSRQEVDPSDWALGSSAALGSVSAPASSGYYAGSASSGYNSSGYNSSGYSYSYGYGCGGYDSGYNYNYNYEPYNCTPTHTLERDMFIDLASGELVLDIVRTGVPSSRLGHVTAELNQVHVDACGVDDTLALSWTQA